MADDESLVGSEQRGDALVVTVLADQFDSSTARSIQAAIEEAAVATRSPAVAVDLANVEFLTSAGLGTLVHLHARFQSANRRFAVCGARGEAATVIRTARLDRLFEVYGTVGEFLLRLRQELT